MGQSHILYNKTKKQMVHPHGIGNGYKLLEQVGWDMSTSTALFLLVSNSNGRGGGDAEPHELIGSWAGDHIVVQGDYAEKYDNGFITKDEMVEYENISSKVKRMMEVAMTNY